MNVVLDLGANIECSEKNLLDFSLMGSALHKALFENEIPKVALLNIGSEEFKGNTIIKNTYQQLNEKKNPLYFVNPEIIWKANENLTYEEGCLSVPNQFAEIDRPKECHVKYLDYYDKPQLLKAQGLLATCIQHEIDHLEGVLFIDYLSKLKKTMIIKKLSKQKGKSERIVV